jgi:hypothetical protein
VSAPINASRAQPRPSNRRFVALACAIAPVFAPSLARGDAPPSDAPTAQADPPGQPAAPPERDRPSNDEAAAHRPRVGAIAGVGFPHPLSIEAMVKIDDYVSLGGEYGVLPTVTVDGVDTHLWSLAGDARVFPFRNAFYLGLRAGRQHVGASGTVTVDSVGLPEQLALDSWYLNPRVGVLWTGASGLTVGAELGVQIPISPTVTSSLPLAYAPEAQRTIDTLGRTVLPTVQLLQIGMMF